jgi:uncharacterized damage-inducible protein DinB
MKLSHLFSNYFEVREELIGAVKSLTQEQLDWTPPNHPASIGRLLAHIADVECFWISCVALRKEQKPDFSKFEKASTIREILSLLEHYHADCREYLESQDVEDWDEVYYEFPEWVGRRFRCSKRWLVWHVVEHQARHRGQIFMLMRMQGIDVPDV